MWLCKINASSSKFTDTGINVGSEMWFKSGKNTGVNIHSKIGTKSQNWESGLHSCSSSTEVITCQFFKGLW